jgi:hypothetical protein
MPKTSWEWLRSGVTCLREATKFEYDEKAAIRVGAFWEII